MTAPNYPQTIGRDDQDSGFTVELTDNLNAKSDRIPSGVTVSGKTISVSQGQFRIGRGLLEFFAGNTRVTGSLNFVRCIRGAKNALLWQNPDYMDEAAHYRN